MFNKLTSRLSDAFSGFIGKKFTEENIEKTLREIRISLLEADLALEVADKFIADIKSEVIGLEVSKGLTPAQELVKIVDKKFTELMGDEASGLNFSASSPIIILLAGIQGAGKTTTAAKIGKWIKEREKKSVMVASCDVYRPAAIEQLKVLSSEADLDFFSSSVGDEPVDIALSALSAAKNSHTDVLIVDTAGRQQIDVEMMSEIRAIDEALSPTETLFVVDGMAGQEAAKIAKSFDEVINITGVVVNKLDADTRGGVVLSVKAVTNKPIKFIGTGEKIDALELFHPSRMSSRILDNGDVLSLIEDLERKLDHKEATKVASKLKSGKGFDLEDFRSQLIQMNTMGGMSGIMDKLPGMGQIPQEAKDKINDGKMLGSMLAVINSMTVKERRNPDLMRGSRKKRVARGSGTDIQTVNKLLKQFKQMQKMMKKFGKGGKMASMLSGLLPSGMNF